MLTAQHYCKEHNTKFFKNEKADQNGELSVWYSHKKIDGSGFCVEKNSTTALQAKSKQYDGILVGNPHYNSMYACNAMNNAINLACNGKIELDQIGQYFQKILGELTKAQTL